MSERDITASVQTEIAKDEVSPCLFAEFSFAGGDLRLWSGIGDKTWNSQTWQGVGYLGKVSVIEEAIEQAARGMDFQLDGIHSELIATVFSETYQGRAANVWLAFLNSSEAVIADPIGPFGYLMDTMQIDEGPETSSVLLRTENRLRLLEKSSNRRSTHEDQQIDYAGDLGYEFVPALQDKELIW